jgi:peptidoglycan hydrolase-like protein with peptidoglycan-binding domain
MPEIKNLQTALSRLGHDPNGIDGKYGNGTYAAVQAFQKANGLSVDGQAGPGTMAAIKKALDDNFEKNKVTPDDTANANNQEKEVPSTTDDTANANNQEKEVPSTTDDAMDPKNQQQDMDTAQPNADVDRYIELLNKLEGGQVNAGTPNATQGQVVASYDFRDLIALVESKLNEQLTQAEMAELKALHDKVQGHVGIPGMDDDKITKALNRYLKLVKEPADKADAQNKASDAQLIAKGQAAKADAQNKASDAQLIAKGQAAKAQSAEPKVSKELYVQMAPNRNADLANFNVSKMKAKYPKPYVDIPNKDGTITRGYGPLKNLEDFVANKGKKFKAKIIGKPAQQAGVPNAELDGAQRGVQTASKDNNMKKAIEEASMNISINGDSAAEVAELAGILKNAGMHDAKPVSDIMPHADNSHDDMMSKMAMVSEPEMDSPCGMDEEGVEEDWDNSPDESYADTQTMTKDLSGGINRQKKAYKAAQPGDNAMAVETSIKEQLWAALNEKMTAEGRGRGKKMKLKASRGNEDIKTTEGSRGKKSRGKKSRG